MTGHAFASEVHQYPECNKQPTETEVQGAKGAFQAGMGSYNEADYERATLYWEDAFRRDCTATLLLHHLARAYEGAGNVEQAVIALRAYLERTPGAADRLQLEKRLETFEQKLAEERDQRENAQKQQAQPAQVEKKSTQPVEEANSTGGLYVNPIIPLAVAGVGVVSAVVGSVIYFPARQDLKDAEKDCKNESQRTGCSAAATKAGNDARSSVNTGGAVSIVGLALAAGGVGWYFFNETRAPKHDVIAAPSAFQPWIGPQTAGLTWQGRF
jgi:tetratricopeptide (TPR) repeat protein